MGLPEYNKKYPFEKYKTSSAQPGTYSVGML